MKNFCKYSFTILIMISCVIAFTLFTVKTLFTDNTSGKIPAEPDKNTIQHEKDTSGSDKNTDQPKKNTDEPGENTDKSAQNTNTPAQNTNESGTDTVVPASPSQNVGFVQVKKKYLDDALFIGDSRTVGLSEYGKASNASFFADTGMSVFNIWEKSLNVKNVGTVSLKTLLSTHKYGKIYLMIGINELGYNLDRVMEQYDGLVSFIREKQPDAILFIEANLHVAKARSDSDKYINNNRINKLNRRMSKYADNKTSFYIDVNEIFDSDEGNLKAKYTGDNTHVLGKYYKKWIDWILTKGINPKEDEIVDKSSAETT